jgi:hypothetical protein
MLLRRINGKKVSPTTRHKHSQSHNGAIAAKSDGDTKVAEIRFNPTMVRLLPTTSTEETIQEQPFNPTMVRLLQSIVEAALQAMMSFQSHNGAIAAVHHADKDEPVPPLSIPHWCDCCLKEV